MAQQPQGGGEMAGVGPFGLGQGAVEQSEADAFDLGVAGEGAGGQGRLL
jgi:hypothetical protein